VINFWKGVVFIPSSPESGPSATYQLGLITDPHGSLIMKSKGTFPFVDFETVPGCGPLGNFVDNYSQSNRAGIRTSRPPGRARGSTSTGASAGPTTAIGRSRPIRWDTPRSGAR